MEETLQTLGEKLVKLDQKLDAFGRKVDDKLDAGFTAVAEHFGKIDERFQQVDEHFQQVDKRFQQVDDRLQQMDTRLNQIDGRVARFDARFRQSDDRFGRLEQRFDNLETRMLTGFDDVKGGLKLVAGRMDDFVKKDIANSRAHAQFEQMFVAHDTRILALETADRRRPPETPEPRPRSGSGLTNSDADIE